MKSFGYGPVYTGNTALLKSHLDFHKVRSPKTWMDYCDSAKSLNVRAPLVCLGRKTKNNSNFHKKLNKMKNIKKTITNDSQKIARNNSIFIENDITQFDTYRTKYL